MTKLELTRRDVLLGGATAAASITLAALPRLARATDTKERTPRNLIMIFARGGWDVTYALDPKAAAPGIDIPAGRTRNFGELPIFVDESRPAVTDFFTAWGSVSCVIRGIHVRSIVHSDCERRVFTGASGFSSPDLGAICGHEIGRDRPAPYLVLGRVAYPGPLGGSAVQVGFTKQIKALIDPASDYREASGLPPFRPDAEDEDAIRRFVVARTERERATRGQRGSNRARLDDFLGALKSGDALRKNADRLGPRAVSNGTTEQLQLGVGAIETGLARAVAVTDDQPGGMNGWDTHFDNSPQGQYHDTLFAGLKALAEDLAARPGSSPGSKLLDETVVAVFSEMSRTPKKNSRGGKDHWPVTSALVFGAGVAGGRAVGATDDRLGALRVNLTTGAPDEGGEIVRTETLAAGLLELVGVDPASYFPTTEAIRAHIA
jgi:uncharacterized protein DUF1501